MAAPEHDLRKIHTVEVADLVLAISQRQDRHDREIRSMIVRATATVVVILLLLLSALVWLARNAADQSQLFARRPVTVALILCNAELAGERFDAGRDGVVSSSEQARIDNARARLSIAADQVLSPDPEDRPVECAP